jgi:uridylate kinase
MTILLKWCLMYKRVLLKLSGEQLSGKLENGIDHEFTDWLSNEIKSLDSTEIVVMIGGGNFVRGATVAGKGIQRVTGDHMGMLATLINALALTDIFESKGIKTRCLSNIVAIQVAEQFVHRLANKHLENGRVVIVAGGIGRPYLTTDTAAVSLALEMDCEVVLKATKVDGVYDKDPNNYDDARKFDSLSHQQAVEDSSITVMDKAAMGLAMEHSMPIIVFDPSVDGNMARVIAGQNIGTTIK